jgi:DNA-binding NarL/FixJ family response regulator
MIKILIADDHPMIRYGLKQIISEQKDIKVTGEAENGKQVFEFLKKNEYDLLILDLNLPDINGVEILKKLKHSKYKIPVLILSAFPEEQYAVRLIKAGASGYLNKIAVADLLIDAIRKIISGGHYISSALSEKLVSAITNDNEENVHEKLSEREFEILCLIASGKTVKDVADKLFLSIPTVYTYRSRILEKMDMKNDNELIQYCIKEGLVL